MTSLAVIASGQVSRLVGGTAEKLGIGYTDMSWDGSRFVTSTGANVVRVYELQSAAYGLDSDSDGAPDACDLVSRGGVFS